MTDRELLELAASAAGLYYWIDGDAFLTHGDTPGGSREWNPLTEDGDAFRLAVDLRIKSIYNEALGQALAWTGGPNDFEARADIEECGRDEYACARRAIVRAAAEIGRAMG